MVQNSDNQAVQREPRTKRVGLQPAALPGTGLELAAVACRSALVAVLPSRTGRSLLKRASVRFGVVKIPCAVALCFCATGIAVSQDGSSREWSRMPLLRVSVRTTLLDRVFRTTVVKPGDVTTRILDANVRGSRTTETVVHVRARDRQDMAQIDLVACGTVSSSTISVAPGARVASAGNHTYEIIKPVFVGDGKLLTKPGYGSLQARNITQSVTSVVSGVPLVGPLGDQIAWQETLRRNPAVEAVIVRQVADEVLPEVNNDVDAELANVNQSWRMLDGQLRSLLPGGVLSWESSSTSDSISIRLTDRSGDAGGIAGFPPGENSRTFVSEGPIVSDGSIASDGSGASDVSSYGVLRIPGPEFQGDVFEPTFGGEPAFTGSIDTTGIDTTGSVSVDGYRADSTGPLTEQLAVQEDLVLVVSEDFLNRLLDIRALEGLLISDAALQQMATEYSDGKDGSETDSRNGQAGSDNWWLNAFSRLKLRDLPPVLFSLQLADSRPVQVGMRNGRVILELTFRVVPKAAAASDLVRLSIPLEGGGNAPTEWTVQAQPVTVEPVDGAAQAGMWSQLIQTQTNQMLSNVPPVTLSRRLDLSSVVPKLPVLELYRIQSEGGQLRVSLRAVGSYTARGL